MTALAITNLPLSGLKRVQRRCSADSRGFFSRLFCATELAAAGWHKRIEQLNHSYTAKRGTVRGLHYQTASHTEMKLVTCIAGAVWDVAVDLRFESKTFLHWHVEQLSADNRCAILIPEGFAHGFQALCDNVELLYCHSAAYHAPSEAGLHPSDPKLNINWPLAISELSARDAAHPLLDERFPGIVL
jgi:dTDP-4-dehydrorhamnose 3,5-epimerase